MNEVRIYVGKDRAAIEAVLSRDGYMSESELRAGVLTPGENFVWVDVDGNDRPFNLVAGIPVESSIPRAPGWTSFGDWDAFETDLVAVRASRQNIPA